MGSVAQEWAKHRQGGRMRVPSTARSTGRQSSAPFCRTHSHDPVAHSMRTRRVNGLEDAAIHPGTRRVSCVTTPGGAGCAPPPMAPRRVSFGALGCTPSPTHICAGTCPHLRRDPPTSAPGPAHICAGIVPTSAPGPAHIFAGTCPHLRRDLPQVPQAEARATAVLPQVGLMSYPTRRGILRRHGWSTARRSAIRPKCAVLRCGATYRTRVWQVLPQVVHQGDSRRARRRPICAALEQESRTHTQPPPVTLFGPRHAAPALREREARCEPVALPVSHRQSRQRE